MSTVYTITRKWDYWNKWNTVHYPFKKGDRIAVGTSARSLPEGVEMVKREVIDAAVEADAVTEEASDGGQADEGAGQAQPEADEAPRRSKARASTAAPEGGS
jgi:hypothetical protein